VLLTFANVLDMARPASSNTHPISFKIPPEWLDMAENIVRARSLPGAPFSRTEVLRAALLCGLTELDVKCKTTRQKR